MKLIGYDKSMVSSEKECSNKLITVLLLVVESPDQDYTNSKNINKTHSTKILKFIFPSKEANHI